MTDNKLALLGGKPLGVPTPASRWPLIDKASVRQVVDLLEVGPHRRPRTHQRGHPQGGGQPERLPRRASRAHDKFGARGADVRPDGAGDR